MERELATQLQALGQYIYMYIDRDVNLNHWAWAAPRRLFKLTSRSMYTPRGRWIVPDGQCITGVQRMGYDEFC